MIPQLSFLQSENLVLVSDNAATHFHSCGGDKKVDLGEADESSSSFSSSSALHMSWPLSSSSPYHDDSDSEDDEPIHSETAILRWECSPTKSPRKIIRSSDLDNNKNKHSGSAQLPFLPSRKVDAPPVMRTKRGGESSSHAKPSNSLLALNEATSLLLQDLDLDSNEPSDQRSSNNSDTMLTRPVRSGSFLDGIKKKKKKSSSRERKRSTSRSSSSSSSKTSRRSGSRSPPTTILEEQSQQRQHQ